MKKVLMILTVVVLVLMVVLAMTKPERVDHYDALKGVVLKAVEAKMDQVGKAVPYESLRTKGTYMALSAANEYLKKSLLVEEKTFYNIGVLVYEDYVVLVSVGVMGHVFLTFDEEDIDKLMNHIDILKMMDIKDVDRNVIETVKLLFSYCRGIVLLSYR